MSLGFLELPFLSSVHHRSTNQSINQSIKKRCTRKEKKKKKGRKEKGIN